MIRQEKKGKLNCRSYSACKRNNTERKNTDAALLDVTKANDKAWITGIMHVLHKQGLSDNYWAIVKEN